MLYPQLVGTCPSDYGHDRPLSPPSRPTNPKRIVVGNLLRPLQFGGQQDGREGINDTLDGPHAVDHGVEFVR